MTVLLGRPIGLAGLMVKFDMNGGPSAVAGRRSGLDDSAKQPILDAPL